MKVKLKQNITVHKIGNKLSIFDGKDSTLYTCNTSAEYIVNGLKLGWSKKKITADLQKKFGAKEIEAEEDYRQILDFLKQSQIIE